MPVTVSSMYVKSGHLSLPNTVIGFIGECQADEERTTRSGIIVHAVDVAEAEDERTNVVTAAVRMYERLTTDLAGRGGFRNYRHAPCLPKIISTSILP